jgi:hypothetical protein
MNHKRGKPKNARAGCLMCKPNKMNGYHRGRGLEQQGKAGFANQRREYKALKDMNDTLED